MPTVYSILEGVAGDTAEQRQQKLRQWIDRYGPPLIGCIVRKYGVSVEAAEDVVQEFLLQRLLSPVPEQNLAGQFLAARSRTPHLRFRNYLRRSLYNFFIDQQRRKRIPIVGPELLETEEVPADQDVLEDVQWADGLLTQACYNVQADCYRNNQANVWKVFEARLLRPIQSGASAASFQELCDAGLAKTAKQAANLMLTAQRKFERVLRDLAAAYLPVTEDGMPDAIRQELADLRKTLSSANGFRVEAPLDYSVGPAESVTVIRCRQLISISDDVNSLWTEADLHSYWQQLLQCTVGELFAELSDQPGPSEWIAGTHAATPLHRLLQEREPCLETLVLLKDTAKQLAVRRAAGEIEASDQSRVFPPDITMLIYGLMIVVARLRWNQRISSDPDHRTIPRVCRLLEFSWLDDATRQILREWLRVAGT